MSSCLKGIHYPHVTLSSWKGTESVPFLSQLSFSWLKYKCKHISHIQTYPGHSEDALRNRFPNKCYWCCVEAKKEKQSTKCFSKDDEKNWVRLSWRGCSIQSFHELLRLKNPMWSGFFFVIFQWIVFSEFLFPCLFGHCQTHLLYFV